MGFGGMEVDAHCSGDFSWRLNRALGVRLGERAGDNVGSLSAEEAIWRIVALLQSAGDELDRQVRGELCSAGWVEGTWAKQHH